MPGQRQSPFNQLIDDVPSLFHRIEGPRPIRGYLLPIGRQGEERMDRCRVATVLHLPFGWVVGVVAAFQAVPAGADDFCLAGSAPMDRDLGFTDGNDAVVG